MTNDPIKDLLSQKPSQDSEFGPYIEKVVISLAFENPELFLSATRFLDPNLFKNPETKYLIAVILNYIHKYNVVPTRGVIKDFVLSHLSEDDNYSPVVEIIDAQVDPREIPYVKDQLIQWARKQAYGLIYSEEGMLAYQNGNFDKIQKMIEEANRITEHKAHGIWFLDSYSLLFQEDAIEHRTTGFPKLDAALNNGGPSPGETVIYMAGTNVGKSIVLCNNAITSMMGIGPNGRRGQNVLLVTFELDSIKTAMRCMGVAAKDIPINSIRDHSSIISERIENLKRNYEGSLLINQLPPEQCSVDDIYAMIDNLRKTKNWKPDVIILDYLDLMVSRGKVASDDAYGRLKSVSSEIRGLAINEQALVFTATQTNRDPRDQGENVQLNLNRVSDSYGKMFSADYVIGIAQSPAERNMPIPQWQFQILKNRNGPRNINITCEVHYDTMLVKEINR